MAVLRSLVTTLGLNASQYRTELQKTQKQTKSGFAGMSKETVKFSKAVASAMAASTASVALYTNQQAILVREASNQARVAGTTVKSLNEQAFAAKQYGLDVQQLSDAYKDAKEKVGDFLNTGGGGFQDFADAMGMSKKEANDLAKELQGLSGKDVLQRMVSEMEKGEVSADQMSHALEGMGSDLTYMLPLLTDGGSEMERLTSKMAAVTNPLTKEDIKQYRDLAENVDLATAAFNSLVQKALVPAAEAATTIAKTATNVISLWSEGLDQQLKENYAQIDVLEKRLETLPTDVLGFQVGGYNEKEMAGFKKELDERKALIAELEDKKKNLNKVGVEATPTGTGGTKPTGGVQESEVKKLVAAYKEEAETVGFTATQLALYEAKQMGANAAQIESIQNSMSIVEAKEAEIQKTKEVVAAQEKAKKEAESLALSLTEGQETLDEKYNRQQEFLKKNLADYEQYTAAKIALDAQYAKEKESNEMQVAMIVANSQLMNLNSMQSAVQGLQQYAEEGSAVAMAAFIASQAIAASQVLVSSEMAIWQAKSTIPNLAAQEAAGAAIRIQRGVSLALIGAQTGAGLAGMAHDGMDEIPQEGTWLLDKGERVVDSRTNADLKAALSNGGSLGGGGSPAITQYITVQGSGDKQLQQALKQAASEGARQGYEMVYKDTRSNGNIYKQVRR